MRDYAGDDPSKENLIPARPSPLPEINRVFARAVQREREARGLTQGDVASRIEERLSTSFDRMTLNRIEGGKRHVRLDEAIAIAYALNTGLVDLLLPDPGEGIEIGGLVRNSIAQQVAGELGWEDPVLRATPPEQPFSYRQTEGGLYSLWSLFTQIRWLASMRPDERSEPDYVGYVDDLVTAAKAQLDLWQRDVENRYPDPDFESEEE